MDLVDAVSIGIPGILPFTVIDRDMDVAPSWETGIDAVLIGVDGAALLDHRLCWRIHRGPKRGAL